MVYRIAKWSQVYTRAESRKLKALNWIAWPVSFTSNGYQLLLDEFGQESPAIYGCWCVLVSFAATCPIRGLLCNSKGQPIPLCHIERITGFGAPMLQRLISWAESPAVSWLEKVTEAEAIEMVKSASFDASGDSPDDPPTRRGIPRDTQQHLTSPNLTRHNTTSPNITGAIAGRWDGVDDGFLDLVREVANRLMRCKHNLEAEAVWQVAWVGAFFDRSVVDEIGERIKAREVQKPKPYIDAAMRRLCEDHGEAWDQIRKSVPKAPPIKQSAEA